MALGADGGGSIRIPAGFCGLVGIKGTFGRVSEHGAAPLCWSVAHIGPLAGTVADAALMFSIMAGPDPKEPPTWAQPEFKLDGALKGELKGLRLGICPDFFDQAEEEVRAVCRKAIDKLKDKGAEVVDLKIDALEYVRVVQYVIIGCEMAAALFEHRKTHKRDFASDTRMLLELASNVPAVDYIRAQRLRTRICRGFDRAFEKADVILSPTTGATAAPIRPQALRHGESDEAVLEANTHFSFAANQTGLPALAVPAGYDKEGLPVGLQVTGKAWDEATIVKVAAAVEQTLVRQRPARFWDLLK
jgi:Asp-tRNA(Asn)/Glu-tRNA(Gln) amidotransferase A subunit family amidase